MRVDLFYSFSLFVFLLKMLYNKYIKKKEKIIMNDYCIVDITHPNFGLIGKIKETDFNDKYKFIPRDILLNNEPIFVKKNQIARLA